MIIINKKGLEIQSNCPTNTNEKILQFIFACKKNIIDNRQQKENQQSLFMLCVLDIKQYIYCSFHPKMKVFLWSYTQITLFLTRNVQSPQCYFIAFGTVFVRYIQKKLKQTTSIECECAPTLIKMTKLYHVPNSILLYVEAGKEIFYKISIFSLDKFGSSKQF